MLITKNNIAHQIRFLTELKNESRDSRKIKQLSVYIRSLVAIQYLLDKDE